MKYKGKYICLSIDKVSRAVEVEIANGKINIEQIVEISTEDFCTGTEVLSISKLAVTICTALKNHNVSTKKIMILSDSLGITTSLMDTDKPLPWYKRDDLISIKKKRISMEHEQVIKFGNVIKNGEERQMQFVASIDRGLAQSIYQEFRRNGFQISCIADSMSTLLNCKELLTHSYDENSKLIINLCEDMAKVIWCDGNIPVEKKTWQLSNTESVSYQLESYMQRDMRLLRLKQPKIFICSQSVRYDDIILNFEKKDYSITCFEQHLEPFEDYTSKYSLLLGLILKNNDKTSINLAFNKMVLNQEEKTDILKKITAAAFIFFLICGAVTGKSAYQYYFNMMQNQQLPTQGDIQMAEKKIEQLQIEYEKLTEVRSNILDIINTTIMSELGIWVASIDTSDMLKQPEIIENEELSTAEKLLAENAEVATEVTAEALESEEVYTPISIIIRGYADSTMAPMKLFHLLKSQWPDNSLLNGIEKIKKLQNDVYAFEMEVIPFGE